MDKVYAHSLATRFSRVADNIHDVFASCAARTMKSQDRDTIEAFEATLHQAGVVLNSTCENMQAMGIIHADLMADDTDRFIGTAFIDAFYRWLLIRLDSPEMGVAGCRKWLQDYPVEYRLALLQGYMRGLMEIYLSSARYQYGMLEEFAEGPGLSFDIDQKKISIKLIAHPKLVRKRPPPSVHPLPLVEESKQKALAAAPKIFVNSKEMTELQVDRFPENDYFETVYRQVANPDLKVLDRLLVSLGQSTAANVIVSGQLD